MCPITGFCCINSGINLRKTGLQFKWDCAILLFVGEKIIGQRKLKSSKRECWNWQTGKTKDLVGVCSCGFKSHLPHTEKRTENFDFIQVFCFFIVWTIRFLSHAVSRFWVVGLLYLVVAVGQIKPVGLFVRCWFWWKCNVLIFILFIRNTFYLNIRSQCGILHLYNRIEGRMWFLIIWCPLILWKEGDALWTQWKFLLYC